MSYADIMKEKVEFPTDLLFKDTIRSIFLYNSYMNSSFFKLMYGQGCARLWVALCSYSMCRKSSKAQTTDILHIFLKKKKFHLFSISEKENQRERKAISV